MFWYTKDLFIYYSSTYIPPQFHNKDGIIMRATGKKVEQQSAGNLKFNRSLTVTDTNLSPMHFGRQLDFEGFLFIKKFISYNSKEIHH